MSIYISFKVVKYLSFSSICCWLLKAHFLAASLAAGAMWLSLVSRQRDWAVMMETESLLLRWWRMRPCSESETGQPSSKEMCWAFVEASFLRRSWKSWERSPYWPVIRQRMSQTPAISAPINLARICFLFVNWLIFSCNYMTCKLLLEYNT